MYIRSTNPGETVSAVTRMEIKEDDVVAIMVGERNRPDINQLISGLKELLGRRVREVLDEVR